MKNNKILKNNVFKVVLPLVAITGLTGCFDESDDEVTYRESASYDLASTDGEWQSGFADYPVGGETEWELTAQENTEFTLSSGEQASGFYLHSVNKSDDTQMYITRKVTDLMPNTHYQVDFEVEMATNVNAECVGIGGGPHAVTVKAGLSQSAPKTFVDSLAHYRLNLDTGQQTQGGLDSQSLGHIGLDELSDCDPSSTDYGLKQFSNAGNTFEVTTDAQGELWLTLLTDSGFEGPSSLFFTKADLRFTPSDKKPEGFTVALDFEQPQRDTSAIFYDYPAGREFEWELTAQPQQTVELASGEQATGYLLHSYNRSDDTGMLLHTPIKGLAANSRYIATFKATLATNVNNMCFGIGGAPHSVYVKSGVTVGEPKAMTVDDDDHYRLNIDLGNNANEGESGVTLGDIGLDTLLDCDPSSETFGLKNFDSIELEKSITITTDETGVVYFSLGTDSGFEGPTTVLFTQASITFVQSQ